MEYITTKDASIKWGISTIRITVLANEGRIPGAKRLGKSWLIPADATKPMPLKGRPLDSCKKDSDNFIFPLYHFCPDWGDAKKAQLSKQQRRLLTAETAIWQCQFTDAYTILEDILKNPEDVITEAGALWSAGICCIFSNDVQEFTRILLRLQLLLSEDFPHRDDLIIVLNTLKTYIETIGEAANDAPCNTSVDDQALPLTYVQVGYITLSTEAMQLNTTDATLLELGLRFLKTTNSILAVEMMHIYLLGIYYLRHDLASAEKHAKAAIQIAYKNKFYFPLITYYRYFSSILTPILRQYPEDFQEQCHKLVLKYYNDFASFVSSTNEDAAISRLDDEDFPYIYCVLTGLTNSRMAAKFGISQQTVKRRLSKICDKLGVTNKKELKNYLHNYM